MLATSYKIIVKLLGLIQSLLPTSVNERQTSFHLGHQNLENISITLLVFDCIQQNHMEALFLKLDFEKAFNRVGFKYIWATLQAMGLGGQFLKLVRVLLEGGSIKIHINGCFSSPIMLEQGARQGCPLAPMFFALSTQPLLAFLQHEQT